MSENFLEALTLMAVGMLTVFVILLLVVVLGNAIIMFVNRFFPETESKLSNNSPPGQVDRKHLAVIAAAVSVVTGGRGRVLKVEKEG